MRFLSSLVCVLSFCFAFSQTDTIPFKLTIYNNIIVETMLNDSDALDLMFHTGASEVSLTEETVNRIKNQREVETTKVLSWGGYSQTEFSKNNKLKIGDMQWDSLSVWTSKLSGHFSDGKFGPNIFGDKLIEIDFDRSIIVLHDAMPRTAETYSKFDIKEDRGSLFLNGVCYNGEEFYENSFMLHSGYSGTILLDDEFAAKSHMNDLEILDESELKDSYGNVLKKKKAMLPKFDLETFDFNDIPVGFFEGKIDRQRTSVIGGEIIKRFNIILDLKNSNIYLKPNELMKLPYKDL